MNDAPLLLNNYPLTGIGDFGLELRQAFGRAGYPLEYEETRPDGAREGRQLHRVVRWEGTLFANVGLTAWGRGGGRNLAGFAALGARVRLGKPTVAFIHNPIEVIDVATAGYRVDRLVDRGAHLATALLRGSRMVAFSPTVDAVLRSSYGLAADLLWPIPCPAVPPVPPGPMTAPPVVLSLGYLSPYKGHALLPRIRAATHGEARFVVVGGPHRVLLEDPAYRTAHAALLAELAAAGIEPLGRIDDPTLDAWLGRTSVGLMPYSSTQGGSSTFSRFASAGVPVVAPRLPLFDWLLGLGAGVLEVDPTPEGFAEGVDRLLGDPGLRSDLAGRQRRFACRHSWAAFLPELLRLAPT